MGVSLGHSRDLMTIAQVSYNVTASVQPRLKLCWFCHFTGWLRPLTITLLLAVNQKRAADVDMANLQLLALFSRCAVLKYARKL